MCRSGAGGGQLALAGLLWGHAHAIGWGVKAVSIQHLEQQVIEGHDVLAFHAVEVLHAFGAGGEGSTERATSDHI